MKITFKFQILNSAFCNHSNIQSTINQSFNQSDSNKSTNYPIHQCEEI